MILENLVIPGQKRNRMPETAEKTVAVRKSDLNEILSFSTIGSEQMQRALILRDFENMMAVKEKEREWKFFDRNYVKPYSKDGMKYLFSRAMILNPDIATEYCAREDGLLCSIYYRNPPGRIIRNQWSVKPSEITDFRGFLKSILGDNQPELINIDEQADTKFFNKDSLIL